MAVLTIQKPHSIPIGSTPTAQNLTRLSRIALALSTVSALPGSSTDFVFKERAHVQLARHMAMEITAPIERTLVMINQNKDILSHTEISKRFKDLCDKTTASLNESMVITDPKLHAKVSGRMALLTEALVDFGNEISTHWKRIADFQEAAKIFLAATPQAFLTKEQLSNIMFTKQKVLDTLLVASRQT